MDDEDLARHRALDFENARRADLADEHARAHGNFDLADFRAAVVEQRNLRALHADLDGFRPGRFLAGDFRVVELFRLRGSAFRGGSGLGFAAFVRGGVVAGIVVAVVGGGAGISRFVGSRRLFVGSGGRFVLRFRGSGGRGLGGLRRLGRGLRGGSGRLVDEDLGVVDPGLARRGGSGFRLFGARGLAVRDALENARGEIGVHPSLLFREHVAHENENGETDPDENLHE